MRPNYSRALAACLLALSIDARMAHAVASCEQARNDVEAIFREDKRVVPKAASLAPTAAAQRFARRFSPLRATIMDEGKAFSASKMLDDLWKLYPLALAAGECSPEFARLLAATSLVEMKRGQYRQSLTFGEAALAIHDRTAGLPVTEALQLHHDLADVAGSGLGAPEKAILHMQGALALEPADSSLDQLQRFGIRERMGYWMHEAHQYEQARLNNAALLADAEKTLGGDDEALLGVLENLAQNTYELGALDASAGYLQRCRALARQKGRVEVESRMLMQLGVLAHERGDDAAAREFMVERIDRMAAEGDARQRAAAATSLTELEQRIRERR